MRIPWRKVLWVYRSADDGWVVSIFKFQWHIVIERIPDPTLSDVVIKALQSPALCESLMQNNALLARLSKGGFDE